MDGCHKVWADALLAAGVLLPRFKVGQEVWTTTWDRKLQACTVNLISFGEISGLVYAINDGNHSWCKSESELFSTEAEAQAALKEMK